MDQAFRALLIQTSWVHDDKFLQLDFGNFKCVQMHEAMEKSHT